MNTEEAKLILGSTHANSGDEADADVAQALSLLDTDPELKSWFEAERAFDDAIAGKLAQIDPPAELKETLVSLLDDRAPAAAEKVSPRKISWLRPQVLAAAAAIVLVPVIALQFFTSSASANSFDDFRKDMVKVAKSPIELQYKDPDLKKLFTWLNERNAICPAELPECVACSDSVGCRVLDWGEQKVTLICLKNEDDQVVHCFIIPRVEFEQLPAEKRIRENLTVKDLETSGWSDKKHVYLLVGSAPNVRVKAPAE